MFEGWGRVARCCKPGWEVGSDTLIIEAMDTLNENVRGPTVLFP